MLTQRELADDIGATNTTVSNWEKGIARPDMDALARIARYFGVSIDELVFFQEPRDGLRPENTAGDYASAHSRPGSVSDVKAHYMAADQERVPVYRIETAADFVSLLTAGAPAPAGYVSLPGMPACDGAVHVRGEGMYPLLRNGDIVLYRQTRDPHHGILWGEIYVVAYELDGEEYLSVRYVQRSEREGCIRLAAYNPAYEPLDIPKEKLRALALVKATAGYTTMK